MTVGIDAALTAGSVDPVVVTVEPRRAADRRPDAPVIPIDAGIERPAPTLAGYNTLLTATGSDQ